MESRIEKVRLEDPKRLDVYLADMLGDLSRTYIKTLIQEGSILVNGQKKKPSYIVENDDVLSINIPKDEKLVLTPEDLNLDIIYEDAYLAVVRKPMGMVVHPGSGNSSSTLVNGLLYRLDRLSNINGDMRPGIVHRLDKDTEGVLVVAKDNETHLNLSEQFKNREVLRRYEALVYGVVKGPKGFINAPIGRHPVDRQKMAVVFENSKEAITHYEVLENFKNYSLLSLNLETGRTHQIRVHMNHINHPIVGDPVYSRGKNEFGLKSQFLYALELGFYHPGLGKNMKFKIDLPEGGKKILESLRRREGSGI